MIRLCSTLLLSLFLVGASKSPIDLATYLAKSVTLIHMRGPNQQWGSCTAFAIREGWGITAEHCVTSPAGFRYTVVDTQRRPLTVIGTAAKADDLALLRGDIFTELPSLTTLTTLPKAGEAVGASGFARGFGPPFFFYTTVARTHLNGFLFHLVGRAGGGMSGSPVANRDGLVVGVLTKTAPGATEVTGSFHFQELYKAGQKWESKQASP